MSRWARTTSATALTSSGSTELVARPPEQEDGVAVEALLDVDPLRLLGERDELQCRHHRLEAFERRITRLLGEHPCLLASLRIPE
jgi:hypothetical protein